MITVNWQRGDLGVFGARIAAVWCEGLAGLPGVFFLFPSASKRSRCCCYRRRAKNGESEARHREDGGGSLRGCGAEERNGVCGGVCVWGGGVG